MDGICNGDDRNRNNGNGSGIPKPGVGGDLVAARAWHHHSSRICRVSRASGGKDRHSKVLTAKGLRDRRVRLSVSTAIQFYDLQDRLGVDQPSKAVEWLIKAASSAIADLPPLDGPFPDPLAHFNTSAANTNGGACAALEDKATRPPPKRKRGGAGGGEDDYDGNDEEEEEEQQQQQNQKTRSGYSSTSDTSKGSVLSLSRSEIRVKARERAKERAAKEKEKRDLDDNALQHAIPIVSMSHNPNSQGSFTELLTGATAGGGTRAVTLPHPNHGGGIRHLPPASSAITTADYFGQIGFFGQGHKPPQHPLGFSSQAPSPFGNSSPIRMLPFNASVVAAATASSDHSELQQQQQQHHISFLQDHFIPVAAAAAAGGDYSLNFSISSGLAGFNRGTLQSNSPTAMPHHNLQRLSSSSASSPHHQVDGSNLPFFLCPSAVAAPASSAQTDNHFHAGVYDGRLQLCYDDGYKHSDIKGKGKG